MTVQFSSQAIAALSAPPLQVWQTITLGTYKGVDAYRDVMDSAGIKIRDSANEILSRPAFPYARVKTEVKLALLSASELGAETESSLSDVYKGAKQVGLALCPAEVGPQLRLHYRNQPLGEALNIAMEPIGTYCGHPTILALVNFGSDLALMGVNGRSESMVLRTSRFVFALPTKRAVAVVQSPPVNERLMLFTEPGPMRVHAHRFSQDWMGNSSQVDRTKDIRASRVRGRKSDSAILVMKATEDRLGCDDDEALNRQRAMNARFIIIRDVPT
jgi:hypothetical protein